MQPCEKEGRVGKCTLRGGGGGGNIMPPLISAVYISSRPPLQALPPSVAKELQALRVHAEGVTAEQLLPAIRAFNSAQGAQAR